MSMYESVLLDTVEAMDKVAEANRLLWGVNRKLLTPFEQTHDLTDEELSNYKAERLMQEAKHEPIEREDSSWKNQ